MAPELFLGAVLVSEHVQGSRSAALRATFAVCLAGSHAIQAATMAMSPAAGGPVRESCQKRPNPRGGNQRSGIAAPVTKPTPPTESRMSNLS